MFNLTRIFELFLTKKPEVKNFLYKALSADLPIKKFKSPNGSRVYKSLDIRTGITRILGVDSKGSIRKYTIWNLTSLGSDIKRTLSNSRIEGKAPQTKIISLDKMNRTFLTNGGDISKNVVVHNKNFDKTMEVINNLDSKKMVPITFNDKLGRKVPYPAYLPDVLPKVDLNSVKLNKSFSNILHV